MPIAPIIGSIGRSSRPEGVALTLDDGPDPDVTPVLLDRLGELGVRCTFFLLSARARRWPGVVRDVVDAGHEVALHGEDHRRVSELSLGAATSYLRDARDSLQQVTGTQVTMFRPPYGSQTLASYVAARRNHLEVVVWSTDPTDWADRPLDAVVQDALSVRPGGIVLLHERVEPDPRGGAALNTSIDRVEEVDRIVRGVRGRGLEPVTVGSMRDLKRVPWFRS